MAVLGRRQDGVFASEQLYALGVSDDRLALLVAQGRLRRRYRAVYVDALTTPTPRAELLAAQLALGPTAFLSHRTAAALHGLRPLNVRAIEVTVVAGHTPRRSGLTVRQTVDAPDPSEVRTRGLLRFSSPARMIIELAPRESRTELERLLGELARRRLLQLDRIDAALRRRGRVPGLAKLRAALDRYRPAPGDASTLERDVADWLATHPEIPPPQRDVHLGDHPRWQIDFLWPEPRLALETDGSPYHLTPSELERDRVKDAWLQRHGYRVLRVTDFRFAHDRPGVLEDLRALVGGRRSP